MNKVEIICDGGCKNNQDPAKREAYGSFILKTTPKLIAYPPIIHKRYYGNRTNNEAEYLALIDALEELRKKYGGCRIDEVKIRTDSQLLIGHIRDGWKRSDSLNPLFIKAKYLMIDLVINDNYIFEKVDEKDMKTLIGH